MKFALHQDLDYVMGYLRYGHKEGIIEVENEEELKELIKQGDLDMDLIVDDYSVDDYDDGGNEVTYKLIK